MNHISPSLLYSTILDYHKQSRYNQTPDNRKFFVSLSEVCVQSPWTPRLLISKTHSHSHLYLYTTHTVSVLGRDEGHTVKYSPLPEGVRKGEARGNS